MKKILVLAFTLLNLFGTAQAEGDLFGNLRQSLGINAGNSNPPFLEADQAFVFTTHTVDNKTIRAHWDITKGYYLYRDKIELTLPDTFAVSIEKTDKPRGQMKHDDSFGDMEVYHDHVDILLTLTAKGEMPKQITLQAKYQGCAEAGLCYPPITKTVTITLPDGAGSAIETTRNKTGDDGTVISKISDGSTSSEQDQLAAMLSGGSTLAIMATFFGLGLLLAFTPCVFPMIPILSSIIVGQGQQLTARRGLLLSLVYVLAMALTYTVAGVIAGLFGENLQAAFQNPWILGSFSAIFVLLSLSMFGFYELQLPASLQSKLTEISNRQQGGTLAGVGIMGFLSALIVGPCVAPPLAGALIYIGQTGDALLGGIALFTLSMGMGAPLLLIGASAGKLLPKAGRWMETIKAVFGVLLLGVAIWMLERILPIQLVLVLWASLLITSAIYMGALEPLGDAVSGWKKLWKGLGLITLLYGSLLLIGAFSGAKDMLEPLGGLKLRAEVASPQPITTGFKRIKSVSDLDNELSAAQQQGKPVILDFYADWCVSCKEMEHKTFANGSVKQALADFVLLQADVTDNDAQDKTLMKRFNLIGPPSIMFFGSDGVEKRELRVVGFMPPDKFSSHITRSLQ